ncbi:MAG: ABC transporter ATP-binding protein [Candidatus Hadarchaeaceae archaeon]
MKSIQSFKDDEYVLEMKGITKRFPGVLANDHIDFTLKKGEIHSILGENGAGKSTLMKILYGLYQPDDGVIKIWGKNVKIRSPKDAIKLGIGLIPQISMLVPTLTVRENIALGLEPSKGPFVDAKEEEQKIRELQKKFGMEVPLYAKPWQLSVGEKQKVEILRAIYRGSKILIMDEPTSMLSPPEKMALLQSMEKMARSGIASVPFITHKIPEVLAVSDRITVLRRGKVTGVFITKKVSREKIIMSMIGREIESEVKIPRIKEGEKVLEVKDLKSYSDKGYLAVKGVSFSVRTGEIFGVAGVAGNGQKELVETIVGLRKAVGGKVFYRGSDITNKSPSTFRSLNVGFVPGERLERGILPHLTLYENVALNYYTKTPYSRRGIMNYDEIIKLTKKLMEEFDIRAPSTSTVARTLSGGNLQKLLLAKELSSNPDFILVEEPTAGLDVGCQEFIHTVFLREKKEKKAILMFSGDLDEIMKLSDTIGVMYEGEMVAVIPRQEATREKIGDLMVGKKI